jgi:hypothetical protein
MIVSICIFPLRPRDWLPSASDCNEVTYTPENRDGTPFVATSEGGRRKAGVTGRSEKLAAVQLSCELCTCLREKREARSEKREARRRIGAAAFGMHSAWLSFYLPAILTGSVYL